MSAIPDSLKQKYFIRRQEELVQLKEWIKVPDFENMRSLGHKLKGSGSMYNFPELSELGKTMEDAAKGLELPVLEKCLEKFAAWIDDNQPK